MHPQTGRTSAFYRFRSLVAPLFSTSESTEITAGGSRPWTNDVPGYSNGKGWALKYAFRGAASFNQRYHDRSRWLAPCCGGARRKETRPSPAACS